MQRLDLNLATNPFRNNMLLWLGYGGAAVLLILFTVWNIRAFVEYRAKLDALEETLGDFESHRRELETRSRRAVAGIRRFDIDGLNQQASKANEVIEWKAFSWTRLFNELERIQPNNVRMNAVRPIFTASRRDQQELNDVVHGSMPVAIEGTARTASDLFEFEHALQDDVHFGRVLPNRVTKTERGEYLFQLSFLYFPEVGRQLEQTEQADTPPAETARQAAEDSAQPAEAAADEPPPAAPQPAAGEAAVPELAAEDVRVEDAGPPGETPEPGEVRSATDVRGRAGRGSKARRDRPGSKAKERDP